MAILQGNQGQTGKQMGQNITASLGEFSEQLMTELQSRYYQQTYRGNKFTATFTAAATAAASTSALCVILNPLSSGKNLIFTDAFVALTGYTAQALAAAILPTTVGTAIATQNCLLGSGAASVAKAYVSATLGVAPVAVRQLAAWALGTATPGADVVSGVHDDIGGAVILTPGNCIALFGLGGTPADLTVQTTLTWDEVYI